MTRLEIMRDGVKRVMIDGYAPGFGYLKKRLPTIREHRDQPAPDGVIPACGQGGWWTTFYPYLRHQELSDEQTLRLFVNSVSALWRAARPYESWRDGKRRTAYIPAINNKGLGKKLLRTLARTEPQAVATILSEYDYEDREGTERYIQNVMLYDAALEDTCGMIEDRAEGWVQELDFRIKEEEQYEDYDAFVASWHRCLHNFPVGTYLSLE